MRKTTEEVPLEPANDGRTDTYVVNKPPTGVIFTKLKLLILLLVFIILIMIIIIIAILLGLAQAKDHSEDQSLGRVAKEEGAKLKTTSLPPTSQPTTTGIPLAGPWTNVRLPDNVLPLHYDLHLNVDPNKDTFSGNEKILVSVAKATPHVLLHSNGLTVSNVAIKHDKKDDSINIKSNFDYAKNSYHVIQTKELLDIGNYVIEIEFSGIFRGGLFGLFRGTYRRNDGKHAMFASTQMEPIDARTMFPCFDEPAFKATFSITITHPKDMMALTNNDVLKTSDKGSLTETVFKQTPKMQTYLVSVVVGKFESQEITSKNGVRLRAFAQPGRTNQMSFSLKMANETLTQLENLFDIKYPMPKLDLVAPPETYIAMENWGSIRFEEDGLLYKKGFSSEEIQQDLLMRWLPHEIAHMWFGNLVTMQWWDDLWLNEALADYYNYFDGSPNSVADWKRDILFIHTNLGDALELDGLVTSRAVVTPVATPNIDTFDDIVYKKGSSLLNMLKNIYPNKDNFNIGMTTYLKDHSYGNAVSDDMWKALQSSCPLKECGDLKEIMETWMTTTGYPVLTIKKSATVGMYTVHQERFLYDTTVPVGKTLWRVQFTYYKGAKKSKAKPALSYTKWMVNKEKVDIAWDGDGWLKGNREQTGFYRVNYDDVTWTNLADQLTYFHTVLSEVDRYGLIDDAFNLARGGRLNITKAFDLINYMRVEADNLPWMGVKKNIGYIQSILPPHSHTSHHLKRYLAFQSKLRNDVFGFKNNGSHLQKLQRLMVVGFQCDLGTKDCLLNMTAMFNAWKKDPLTTSITPALRKLVYYYGVRRGTQEDWERVLKELQKTTIPSELQPLLMGLAGTRDRWTLNRYLTIMRNQSIIKQQYAKYVLDNVANNNPDGAELAWRYLLVNWIDIKQKSGAMHAMLTYLPTITKRFSTQHQLNMLTNFINENLNGQPKSRQLNKVLEIVKLNIAWREAHEGDLEKWLKDFLVKQKLPVDDGGSEFSAPA